VSENDAFRMSESLLRDGELADAIGAYLDALNQDPEHLDSYFGLMRAYETTYEVLPDPELLHQVTNVLRGLRDRELTAEQAARADEAERRVAARLEEAGHPPRRPAGPRPPDRPYLDLPVVDLLLDPDHLIAR